MRYVYVKNGDAVEQVRRMAAEGSARGGPEAFLADFIAAHSNDDVLLLCKAATRERLVIGKLSVESSPTGHSRAARGLMMIVNCVRIAARIWRWKPDRILCGASKELLWVCVLMARVLRVPVVCSRHTGLSARTGVRRLVDGITRASIRACDATVAHGPFLRDQVIALGVDASRAIEFDVDLSSFCEAAGRPVPAELQSFMARFPIIVMFLGRIQGAKGVLDLLHAFHGAIHSRDLPAGLVFVGQGRDLARLERNVHKHRLDDRVLLLGKVTHHLIAAVLRCATVVVTPTKPPLTEGRCMVALESMALGVPVIAPNYAAFPYVVQDGVNGLLFDVGSVDAMRACILRILQDGSLTNRLQDGARQTAARQLADRRGFADAVGLAFDIAARRHDREG